MTGMITLKLLRTGLMDLSAFPGKRPRDTFTVAARLTIALSNACEVS